MNHGADGTAVTAVPDTGYHFVNWSDGVDGNPRTDTNVTANVTVTANFAINTYTLTYTAGRERLDQRHISADRELWRQRHSGDGGTRHWLHFVNWSDGSTQNPRTDTNVTMNIMVTANFASANANLSNLVLSDGALNPAFDPDVTNYTADERHRTTSITVTPNVQDANATITVNGQPVPSGQQSQSINLNVGNNTITIVVHAEDEGGHPNAPTTIKTYTITANRADVPVVTNTNDSGVGSLRDALDDVLDDETITFNITAQAPNVAQVITLTSGELVVDKNVTISGPGANVLEVTRDDSAGQFRIFHVMPSHTVTIEGTAISNGSAQSGSAVGRAGGGIYNDHSTLTVNSCTLSANSAADGGAGIFSDGHPGSASLAVMNSTLSGNLSGSAGGGIYSYGQNGNVAVIVANTTFSSNTSFGGGGIFSIAANGVAALTVTNSTFYGNTANGPGGGIYNLQNGGGVATVDIGNTILNSTDGGILNVGGSVTSHGYNLSNDLGVTNGSGGTGSLNATGDQTNTDPMLGPLKDNGGPTLTHAPLLGSPTIDQGKRDAIAALTTNFDQRGLPRPVDDPATANAVGGDGSDIGAVEIQQFINPISAASWKTHGGAGSFPIELPLAGALGIECRSGGSGNDYQLIVSFPQPITFSGAALTSGVGMVSSASTSPNDVTRFRNYGVAGTQAIINLTGVVNAQTITVALFDVDDGTNQGDVGVRMGVLIGDSNGSGDVTATDVSQVKLQSGQAIGAGNFRSDVIANGVINATDVSAVKLKSGTGLP